MIGYFSLPSHEELLWSAVARHVRTIGHRRTCDLHQELLGKNPSLIALDLPRHLEAFISRLPPGSPISADELIDHHTLLPYYARFMRPPGADQARQKMKQAGVGLRGVVLSLQRNSRHRVLRSCRSCATLDEKMYGFMAWKRAHQAPFVNTCHEHDTELLSTAEPENSRYPAAAYPALSQDVLRNSKRIETSVAKTLSRHIAASTTWLLTNVDANCGTIDLPQAVRRLATGTDLLKEGLQRAHKRITEAYGDSLKDLGLGLPQQFERNTDWISRLFFQPGRPIKYILILHYLGAHISELFAPSPVTFRLQFNTSVSNGAIGNTAIPASDKAPCANPFCPENRKDVAALLLRNQTNRVVKIKCGNCGHLYQWRRTSPLRLVVLRPGKLWSEGVLRFTESTVPHEFSHQTIKNYIQEHTRAGLRQRTVKPNAVLRRLYRQRCISAKSAHPEMTRTDLRHKLKVPIRYLRRNDLEWAQAFMRSVPRKKPAKIDWSARDTLLTQQARGIVAATVATTDKPKRATATYILSRLKLAAGGHIRRQLPNLDRYMRNADPHDAYAKRALKWGIQQLIQRNKRITLRSVAIAAHLTEKTVRKLQRELAQAVAKIQPISGQKRAA